MAYKRNSPQPVVEGGSGAQSFTAYSVIAGGTTGTGPFQNVSGVGTSGQVLTSNGAAALPTWQPAGGASFTWVNNVNTDTSMLTNHGYILTNAFAMTPNVNMLLPTTSAVGDMLWVLTTDISGSPETPSYAYFTITQNTSQYMIGASNENNSFGQQVSSTVGTGGSVSTVEVANPGAAQPTSLQLICIVADTAWAIVGGNCAGINGMGFVWT